MANPFDEFQPQWFPPGGGIYGYPGSDYINAISNRANSATARMQEEREMQKLQYEMDQGTARGRFFQALGDEMLQGNDPRAVVPRLLGTQDGQEFFATSENFTDELQNFISTFSPEKEGFGSGAPGSPYGYRDPITGQVHIQGQTPTTEAQNYAAGIPTEAQRNQGLPTEKVRTFMQMAEAAGLSPEELKTFARQQLATDAAGSSLIQEKANIYQAVHGLSVADSYKRAMDDIVLREVTERFTGRTYQIEIDKIRGDSRIISGANIGTRLSPEQTTQLLETQQVGPEQSAASMMEPVGRIETMSGAEASAVGTGSAAATARNLGSFLTSAFFQHGVEDSELLAANSTISDINLLGSALIRDEAGTARLAGVTELEAMRKLLPQTGFFGKTQEQNITDLIRLRSRIENDMALYTKSLEEPHSIDFMKDVEGRIDTSKRMLDRIGSREELAQALERVRKTPQDTQKIFDVFNRAVGEIPEVAERIQTEAARVGVKGLPEPDFQALVARALANPDSITEEELDTLSKAQERELLKRIREKK